MGGLKQLVPPALRPLARRVAARLRRPRPRQRLTAAQLERFPGLKCIVSYNEYGADFGDFLPALSSGCAPGARIWAFEPNPENYRCARVTLELNGISNVTLANAGLGAQAELLGILTADEQGLPLGGASRIVQDDDAAGSAA